MTLEATMWADTAIPQPATSVLEAAIEADVVVIGGGFTGTSAALHLAESGTDVVILEAEQIGSGCSSRNQGNGSPTLYGALPDAVVARYGNERGRPLIRMVADSKKLVVSLIKRYDIHCGLVENGCLWVAENKGQTRQLDDWARQWSKLGHRIEPVDRDAIPTYIPTKRFVSGYFSAENIRINPASYVRGLASAALAAGAKIFTESPAVSIEPEGRRWRVKSLCGEVVASRVLIATNSHTGNLWPGLRNVYYPMPLAMFATEPYPDSGRAILKKGIPFHNMSMLTFFGVFFDSEGRMIGGIVPPVNQHSTNIEAVTAPMTRKFRRIFPHLSKPEWKYLWGGTMAMTPDLTPRLLELATGVYAALGFSGSGICPATAVGQQFANFLSSDDPRKCAMPILQVKQVPLRELASVLMRWVMNPLMRQAYKYL